MIAEKSLMQHFKPRPCRLVVFIAALFLTACATSNIGRDYALQETSEEGLVVLSVSHEGIGSGERTSWYYRRIDGSLDHWLASNNLFHSLDWESPPGRLAYFALPPGRYEVYESNFRSASTRGPSWHIGPGNVVTNNNPNYAGLESFYYTKYHAKPFSVPFDIVAGQATYIGNLHFVWNDREGQGKVIVTDRGERDLPLLRKRLPNLRSAQIRTAAREQ